MENFDFDMDFTVFCYSVTAVIRGYTIGVQNIGSNLSEQTKALINDLKKGNKVYFEGFTPISMENS